LVEFNFRRDKMHAADVNFNVLPNVLHPATAASGTFLILRIAHIARLLEIKR
jgi:hypothetical protein